MGSGKPEPSNAQVMEYLAGVLGCDTEDLSGYIVIGICSDESFKLAANLATTEAVLATVAYALSCQLGMIADKSVARRFN